MTARVSVSTTRVRYAETDQMGVVYYANYLIWFEVGRTDWLRETGWTYRSIEADGFQLPVTEAHCEYRQGARYDDELDIRTRASQVSPVRIRFDYEVVRRADGVALAGGHTVHATIGPSGRPARLKALVTGGAGFIGSTLSERLLAQGASVRAIDAFTDFYPRPLKERNLENLRGRAGYDFIEGDLRELDLDAALDGVTHVFHLAAQAGVRRSWGKEFQVYTGLNIDSTQRLLEACATKPIERLVYASSSSVYGDEVTIPMTETALPQPVSPYGVTKLAAEQLCHLYYVNYGVPAVSLRYFTVYGPRQRPDMGFNRFFSAVLAGKPLIQFGDGLQTRDFTFVADAVTATAAAAVRGVPGRVYNIGGGSRVSLREVFDLIARVSGRKVTIDQQSPQKGDMRDTYADTTLARQDLAFAPSVTLEEGLRAMWRWMEATNA